MQYLRSVRMSFNTDPASQMIRLNNTTEIRLNFEDYSSDDPSLSKVYDHLWYIYTANLHVLYAGDQDLMVWFLLTNITQFQFLP